MSVGKKVKGPSLKSILAAVYSILPDLDGDKDGSISREELLKAFRESITVTVRRRGNISYDFVNVAELKPHEIMSVEEINDYKNNIPRLSRSTAL